MDIHGRAGSPPLDRADLEVSEARAPRQSASRRPPHHVCVTA
jgi:hypothetical protein